MTSRRAVLLAIAMGVPYLVSCERSHAEGGREITNIRMSTGLPTGTFGPFTEALAKGYARLAPELRIELVDTKGSVRNLEALETGAVDLGLAQSGIAYMAYNGRLSESDRPLRNIRAMAVLNSSTVHLLVGPELRANSIDDLSGLRVGVGVLGTGNALTSALLLSPYRARAPQTIGVVVGQTADALLARRIDAAFTISGIPHDDVGRATRGGARLVHVAGPAVDRLRSAYPFFRSAVIPPGTYPNQPEAVKTLSIDVVLLTRKNLDAGLVRRLTAGLFMMLPKLSAELDFLHDMDPERAPATPVPLHPGATLYYRERELSR